MPGCPPNKVDPGLPQLVDELLRVNERCFRLIEQVATNAGIDVRSQDVRLVALDSIQQNLVACGFWF